MDKSYWQHTLEVDFIKLTEYIGMEKPTTDFAESCIMSSVGYYAKSLIKAGKELLFHQSVDLSKRAEIKERNYCAGWQVPYKAVNVVCPDGKRRTALTNISPDTYFSIGARLRYKGKTVSGFLTSFDREDGERDLQFVPSRNGKNYSVFEQFV